MTGLARHFALSRGKKTETLIFNCYGFSASSLRCASSIGAGQTLRSL